MTPTETFNQLQGAWRFERKITPGGVMRGDAVFNQAGTDAYDYEEQGRWTLDDGTVGEFSKRYSYRVINDDIHVYYADGVDNGKLFHVLEFDGIGQARAEHLCGQDLYVSAYKFTLPEKFQVTHTVQGPKKDYVSVTNFTPS